MISLDQYRVELKNLHHTIAAIENLDVLIDLINKNHQNHTISVQIPDIKNGYVNIHSDILISTLTQQKDKLIAYLASIGIDASS